MGSAAKRGGDYQFAVARKMGIFFHSTPIILSLKLNKINVSITNYLSIFIIKNGAIFCSAG
jgi:hypothetical protein